MTKVRDLGAVLIANPGADLYGSDRMALETVRALVADGRRVTVTVPAYGPLVPLLTAAGADVMRCNTPVVRKGLLSLRGLFELMATTLSSIGPSLRVLRRSHADTVIVNTVTPPLWLALARLTGRNTVCHVHEGEASVNALLRRTLYLPLVFAHRIVVNSRFSLSVLVESAPWLAERSTVVYNAVATPPEVTPPRGEIEGPARILYVGRLSPRKGAHVAIEAFRLLLDMGTDAELSLLGTVFPGYESYLDELHRQVNAHGLSERVTFLGFKPSVWADIASADVVLIPSTVDEPFGNTAVEAALAARPSVVSRVGGLPEASGYSSSAVLVPPGDAAALAGGVRQILDHWHDYAHRATADATAVAAEFSTAHYAQGILDAVSMVPRTSRNAKRA